MTKKTNHSWFYSNQTKNSFGGGCTRRLAINRRTKPVLSLWFCSFPQRAGWIFAIFLLHATLIPFTGLAQQPISMRQAIDSALLNRKNIKAGRLTLTINRLQTKALLKKYWPQAALEYTYQYNPILQTSVLPISEFNPAYPPGTTKGIKFGTKWSQTAGLTLSQPLFDATIRRQLNEFELQEKITAASQVQSEYDLAYDVAQAYLNTGLQQSQVQSCMADTARTWVSYKLQKDKFDESRLLKSDLNKALINHNNAVQKLEDAVSQLVEDKLYLLFLIGQAANENADVIIDTAFYKHYTPTVININAVRDSIPELQKLQLQAQLPGLQIVSEKAKYLPTVGLKGFVGANQYTNNFNPAEPNTWFGISYIGLDVKLPVLFGEDKQSKIKQLQIQASQLKMQQDDIYAQYAKDAATAALRMNRIKAQLTTFEENFLLEEETILIMQERVKEGQETASALNTEEANFQSNLADYEKAKKQWWLYWLDYLKASGQLSKLWQ